MFENENKEAKLLNQEKEEVEEIKPDVAEKGNVSHPITKDVLQTIIRVHNTVILNATVDSYDPINIAKALEQLDDPEDLLFFFKAVKSDNSAEVFTYLEQESKEKVIQAFSSEELHKIVDSMATDDLVDFVDELPANLINKVLKAADPTDRQRIRYYLNFKEDSAGSLMTPEYLQVRLTDKVKDAIAKIRRVGEDLETIWTVFVVDNTRRLVGSVNLDKIVEADEDETIESIMNSDFVSVNVNTDQEVVLQAFRKYDVSVIPVTNKEQRILGIITFDDALDVASDENTEDIQLSSAVAPIETPYLKTSVWKLVKNYGIWLILLLALDTFTSTVMSYLSAPLALLPVLTAFLPTLMGTNGNASDQSSTIAIRELALGNLSVKNYYKAAWKELRIGLITAAGVAIFSFGWMLVELYANMITLTTRDQAIITEFYGGNNNIFFISLAGLIALTFFVTITLAKLLGVSLPVFAKLIHVDPALMSQPVLSTLLDILSIVFFYAFSLLIMKGI
jgi:magnesium transporter